MPIKEVQFGEILTASLWNDMVSEIHSLKEGFSDHQLKTNKHQIAALLGLHYQQQGIILNGCVVQTETDKVTHISSGWVLLEGEVYVAPAFEPVSPVSHIYLQKEGEAVLWVEKPSRQKASIGFTPHTSQYLADVRRRYNAYQGEIRMMAVTVQDFDETGLGQYSMLGWAICNGANGTVNLTDKTVRGTTTAVGAEAGQDAVSLKINNMPPHNHQTSDDYSLALDHVPPGGYGLMRRPYSGENHTGKSFDSGSSGSEPDIRTAPTPIPMQGSATPFSVVNKHVKVLFIQRL